MTLIKSVLKDVAEVLFAVWLLFSIFAPFWVESLCEELGTFTGLSLFAGNYLLLFIALSTVKHVKGPHD